MSNTMKIRENSQGTVILLTASADDPLLFNTTTDVFDDVVIQQVTFFAGAMPKIVARAGINITIQNIHIWNMPRPKWYQLREWWSALRYAIRYWPTASAQAQWGIRAERMSASPTTRLAGHIIGRDRPERP